MGKELQPFGDTSVSSEKQAIRHFREAVAGGKHWYVALLEAVGMWNVVEESYKGQEYRYLIDNEAFDWMLLAERILDEVNHLVPQGEVEQFLFHCKPPIELSKGEFRRLIGEVKYQAYLNYFYGVTVEEALLLVAEEEARKERITQVLSENGQSQEEAYVRIYGATADELLKKFRKDRGYSRRKSMELGEMKEFTYWLFKFRLDHSDKARVASDTKKALEELGRQRGVELL
jgi:hypothetical protein